MPNTASVHLIDRSKMLSLWVTCVQLCQDARGRWHLNGGPPRYGCRLPSPAALSCPVSAPAGKPPGCEIRKAPWQSSTYLSMAVRWVSIWLTTANCLSRLWKELPVSAGPLSQPELPFSVILQLLFPIILCCFFAPPGWCGQQDRSGGK